MNRDIAIVGMVCKTPGAEHVQAFWDMLCTGRSGLRSLTQEEIARYDTSPDENRLLRKPAAVEFPKKSNKVYAGGFIDGIDQFDPDLFNLTARDACYMDPQHRLLLQACWEALEVSGHASAQHRHIGVFASAGFNSYLPEVVMKHGIDEHQYQSALIGNSLDCLATRVSYSLNLSGPSMTIQCGCSSALVALHQARLALLAQQCDAALVGGISLAIPHYQGYMPVEGGFSSTDGVCRPFSDDANGTVFSSGYGVIVLKRLADAVRDGDLIFAILKGSAINNDGADKASFTAPSVEGQAAVIAKALRVANVPPESIQYIEAHGTGTPIGDPIELSALTQIMQHPCVLGSVKANIGHLDVAAGIIGLIKTSLMLYHKTLPPQIHFQRWNRHSNPHHLRMVTSKEYWDCPSDSLRRAGVSSFGFGGTNAHIILEEFVAQSQPIVQYSNLSSLVVLSAKSPARLLQWITRLRDFLQQSSPSLASLAYTLQTGRKQWPYRVALQVTSIDDLLKQLTALAEDDIVATTSQGTLKECTSLTVAALREQWLLGYEVNWQQGYAAIPSKCEVPAAPLTLDSYWLTTKEKPSSPLEKRTQAIDSWLYQSTWKELSVTKANSTPKERFIFIGNLSTPSFKTFIEQCKAKQWSYCLLESAPEFNKITASHYQLDWTCTEHITSLEHNWQEQQFKPTRIIQWIDAPTEINEAPQLAINLLLTVTKTSFIRNITQITHVVWGMSDLFCSEHNPVLTTVLAMNRGIRQEFPHLDTRLVDLSLQDTQEACYEHIVTTIQQKTLSDYVVWRDKKCWQIQYEQVKTALEPSQYFKQNGVYLITGGLGNVASVYVDFLATEYKATLILLGRSALPADDRLANEQPHLKEKIERLNAWRTKDFSIIPACGDVTSLESLKVVCESVIATHGTIDGIIHIAGAGSDMHYKMLTDLTGAHCRTLFEPKLKGVKHLHLIMQQFNIPDCLVISSISAALAGIGLSAYAASHNLLDAYVKKEHPTWRIMNWDAWNFHQKERVDPSLGNLGAAMDKLAITPQEGLMVLRQAFTHYSWQQLYISTLDLPLRLKQWLRFSSQQEPKKKVINYAPRPSLRTEYVAAATAIQQQLTEIWAALLSLQPIGIHDSFFELGGDSLLALELIHKLQGHFGFACSVMDLFESATIAQLAQKIGPMNKTQGGRIAAAKARIAKQHASLARVTQ